MNLDDLEAKAREATPGPWRSEISKEFRHKNKKGIEDEMADVLSWIFAVANRRKLSVADIVWSQYPYECDKCRESICKNCESSASPERRNSVAI